MHCRLIQFGLFTGMFIILTMIFSGIAQAQERDTTESKRQLRLQTPTLNRNVHSERSVNNLSLPSSGVYKVPKKTKYYQQPFKGQYYLDLAVEAYREVQRDKLGLNWLFRFMNMMAPYVNNQFEFGVYQIEDMPIVDRDNPLLKPDQ